jgi:hypothetical protein
MASGDTVLQYQNIWHVILLDAIAAADDGVWIDCSLWDAGSIHYVASGGSVGLTVEIRGSNAPVKPANSVAGGLIGTSGQVFNAAGEVLVSIDYTSRWIKARVVSYTAGTVSVYAILRTSW